MTLFQQQLENLMNVLHETRPHFVRCIIPNHEKKPGNINIFKTFLPVIINIFMSGRVISDV